MAQIIIQRDPSNITSPDVHQVGHVNLLDWLCDNEQQDFGGLHCEFILNGKTLCNTWDFTPEECNKCLDTNLSLTDSVVCIVRPAGDPLTTILIVTAVLAAGVVIALTPKLNAQPVAGDNTDSQSAQLNSSTNSYLRIGDAIDDNAGQIVKTPKFLQRSYYEYDNSNKRVFTEYFLIGVGQYDAEIPKEGETPFNLIPGYEHEYLPPGSHPTSLLNVRRAPSSQDVDLLSEDQQERTINPAAGSGDVTQAPRTIKILTTDFDQLELNVGDQIQVNLNCESNEPGNPDFVIAGTYDVDVITNLGASTAIEVSGGPVFTDEGVIISGFISNLSFVFESPWYVLDGDAIDEVWFQVTMPSGIRKGDGTAAEVQVRVEIEQLDSSGTPTGIVTSRFEIFYGNTQAAQRSTFKFTGLTQAKYRAKATRTTPDLGDNSLDLMVLEGVDSVTYYTPNWGDITALRVQRASAQRVNRGQSTKINCLITRKLQTFSSGSTYIATRNFSDYAYYLLSDLAEVSDVNVDTTALFGIMSGLSSQQLGYFDYQFDDRNSSLRERLNICCNVARVRYYNEGLNWTFTREEPRPTRMALFNRRNLKPQSAQFVQKFRRPNDYDGVTLVYVDPEKNSEKRINKRIFGGEFIDGLGSNSFEFNLAGCRNDAQALNRLNLEIRRLVYQNVKVTDVSIGDAITLPLGERVDWVDMFDGEIFSGEIMGQKDALFATSERFTPSAGVDYLVYVTDENGEPSSIVPCLPRSDGTVKGFEASGLFTYTGNQVFQAGSRYVIASANNYEASSFTLIGKGKPNEKGEVQIELAEYSDLLFAGDAGGQTVEYSSFDFIKPIQDAFYAGFPPNIFNNGESDDSQPEQSIFFAGLI